MLIVRLVVPQPNVMSINFNLNLRDDRMANTNSQMRDLSTRMGLGQANKLSFRQTSLLSTFSFLNTYLSGVPGPGCGMWDLLKCDLVVACEIQCPDQGLNQCLLYSECEVLATG